MAGAPRDGAVVPPCPGRFRGPGLHSHPHLFGPQLNPKPVERSVSLLWGGGSQGYADGALRPGSPEHRRTGEQASSCRQVGFHSRGAPR